jgi:head-tail adaptor
MGAGHLRERLAFEERAETDDGYGNTVGAWEERFVVAAQVTPRMGSEPVIAARLQGIQPVTIRVRSSSQTRRIAAGWRARDVRSGVVYAIASPGANVDQRDRYLDFLAEQGRPT